MEYSIDAKPAQGVRHLAVRTAFIGKIFEDEKFQKVIHDWMNETPDLVDYLAAARDLDHIAREAGFPDREALWGALHRGDTIETASDLHERWTATATAIAARPLPNAPCLFNRLRTMFDNSCPEWPWLAENCLERIVRDFLSEVVGNPAMRSIGMEYFRLAPVITITTAPGETREELAERLEAKAKELRGDTGGRIPRDLNEAPQIQWAEWLYETRFRGRTRYSIARELHKECRDGKFDKKPCNKCKSNVRDGLDEATKLMSLA